MLTLNTSLHSFVLVCHDLGMPNVEYEYLIRQKIADKSIEQWANYSVNEFTRYQKMLSPSEKDALAEYLVQCEKKLHPENIANNL